jgi:hypothetical protein
VYRTSGSLPRLPIRITLLTLAMGTPCGNEVKFALDSLSEIALLAQYIVDKGYKIKANPAGRTSRARVGVSSCFLLD